MLLTKADKWLIAVLLLAAIGGIAWNLMMLSAGGQPEAHVYQDGRLIQVVKLRPGYSEQIRLGGVERYNIIMAENGRIRIAEADCPDQICVRTSWVSRAPQQIVCLPYRVVIKIVSAASMGVDDIAR